MSKNDPHILGKERIGKLLLHRENVLLVDYQYYTL